MAIRKSSGSGIPFGNTAGRPANPGLGQLYSNGEAGRLELYTNTGWQNIVQETPGVASVTGTYNQSAGSGTFIVSGTNFVSGGIAYAVGTNGVEYQASSSVTNSIVQMTVEFSDLSAAYEPYDIKILNPSNLFGLLPDAFYINDNPVWSTSAGSLGSYVGSVSIQLSATDDESNSLSYSVTSGALPTGLSLSSAGLISGTISATPGTYTFTVSVSDGSNTGQTRSFSMIVLPTITGGTITTSGLYRIHAFTSNGTFETNASSLNVEYLLIGGGGAGGDDIGAGGGAGGLLSGTTSLLAQPYSIVIGAGGAASVGFEGSGNGNDGNNSSALGLTAYKGQAGGGEGNGQQLNQNGPYGSGGGGGYNAQSGGSGTVGQGNNGGSSYGGISAGGGGAGGAGQSTSSGSAGGNGGPGVANSILGTEYYWAGGGGGNSYAGAQQSGNGGIGGGGGASTAFNTGTTGAGSGGGSAINNGNAGSHTNGKGGDAGANTGGGGGGSKESNSAQSSISGAGGSGIFVVRYLKSVVGL